MVWIASSWRGSKSNCNRFIKFLSAQRAFSFAFLGSIVRSLVRQLDACWASASAHFFFSVAFRFSRRIIFYFVFFLCNVFVRIAPISSLRQIWLWNKSDLVYVFAVSFLLFSSACGRLIVFLSGWPVFVGGALIVERCHSSSRRVIKQYLMTQDARVNWQWLTTSVIRLEFIIVSKICSAAHASVSLVTQTNWMTQKEKSQNTRRMVREEKKKKKETEKKPSLKFHAYFCVTFHSFVSLIPQPVNGTKQLYFGDRRENDSRNNASLFIRSSFDRLLLIFIHFIRFSTVCVVSHSTRRLSWPICCCRRRHRYFANIYSISATQMCEKSFNVRNCFNSIVHNRWSRRLFSSVVSQMLRFDMTEWKFNWRKFRMRQWSGNEVRFYCRCSLFRFRLNYSSEK